MPHPPDALRFQRLVESSPLGMHFYRLEAGRLVFAGANPAADRILRIRHAPLVGKTIEEAFPPLAETEIPARYRAAAESGEPYHTAQVEYRDDRIAGAFEVHAFRTAPGELAVTFLDVTERRRMEERLRQAEKLQGIGRLAGGVAHDFNNQLTGILANADFLVGALAGAPELRTAAEEIRAGAQRSARLTRQLLAIARKGNVVAIPVDVHEAIADVITLLRRSIDKRIAISTDLRAVPSVVIGDPTQLHNALLNLALNARDAMPDGGTLRFATRVVTLPPERRAELHAPLPEGPLVEVSVTDDGAGMDAETLAHVFEPFFTTKRAGEGVGLGLAAVYGTVESHGGAITVASAPGRGTTFTLWLPRAEADVAPPDPLRAASPRRARILVIDDERLVRDTLVRALRQDGHEVLLASGGVEGVTLYSGAWRDLDLVVLDMVMPDLGGREVHAALTRINPEVRVVLSSGYTLEGAMTDAVAGGRAWVLQKPYALEDLRRVVGEALGAAAAPPAG